MTLAFTDKIPVNFYEIPILISGKSSVKFAGSEYLLVQNEDIVTNIFEIKYKYHCSPFKEASLFGNLLLVGHEAHFYLYDLHRKQNILTLEMGGYFGHLYIHHDLFYVSDSGSMYCLNQQGDIIWKNENLGIDGVIVEKFTEDMIYGSGECDPPGGWIDFVLNLKTGDHIKQQHQFTP